MKTKIAILSGLLCIFAVSPINASDCGGVPCFAEPLSKKLQKKQMAQAKPAKLPVSYFDSDYNDASYIDTTSAPAINADYMQLTYAEFENTVARAEPFIQQPESIGYLGEYEPLIPVRAVEIKTVLPDARPPVFDGNVKNIKPRAFDKTVDWRDGVPIWDDSISNYKDKDFSDWLMEPRQEALYIEGADLLTRKQVSDILTPYKPRDDIWTSQNLKAQDLSCTVKDVFNTQVSEEKFNNLDGCPFETNAECAIWRKKPMVRETVSARSPKIQDMNMTEIIAATKSDKNIAANNQTMAPLLNRYQMLMKSAEACCTDGMAYELKRAGASEGLIYKFLIDDANFYQIGNRCLMMTDADFDTKYKNQTTATVAADVRNGCLCRGRQWFSAMLAPFQDVYKASPEFANSKFNYTYTDGLQRDITVSVNNDVKNVLNQLAVCP